MAEDEIAVRNQRRPPDARPRLSRGGRGRRQTCRKRRRFRQHGFGTHRTSCFQISLERHRAEDRSRFCHLIVSVWPAASPSAVAAWIELVTLHASNLAGPG